MNNNDNPALFVYGERDFFVLEIIEGLIFAQFVKSVALKMRKEVSISQSSRTLSSDN